MAWDGWEIFDFFDWPPLRFFFSSFLLLCLLEYHSCVDGRWKGG